MTSPDSREDLAIFTMVYNENVMLPLWVRHYSKQTDPQNLYILNHGGNIPPLLPPEQIIQLERHDLDEIDRTTLIQNIQKQLLKYYRFVLFTDCDEFVIANPEKFSSLQDYAARTEHQTVQCTGIDIIDHQENLPPLDWTTPILRQRPYGILSPWSCKTLLSSIPLIWNPGFHTSQPSGTPDSNLWLFHLKYADQSHLLERLALTRTLTWSHRALTLKHGSSHRIPDFAMLNFLHTTRQTLQDASLTHETPENSLRRVPEIFLNAL